MCFSTGKSNPNFTLDLSTFDISKVTDMSSMFVGSSNLKTIYVSDKWDIDTVTYSINMFRNCISLPNFDANVIDKTNAHYGEGGYLTLKKILGIFFQVYSIFFQVYITLLTTTF